MARVGRIHTPHGIIDTPGYVAVATNGALKVRNERKCIQLGSRLSVLLIALFVRLDRGLTCVMLMRQDSNWCFVIVTIFSYNLVLKLSKVSDALLSDTVEAWIHWAAMCGRVIAQ